MAAEQRRRRHPLRMRRAAPVETLERRALLAAVELIQNGAFADNATSWTLSGDWRADAFYSTTNGRSNPGYAYLAKNGLLADSVNTAGSLAQSVTIPGGVDSATLTFYTKLSTQEAAGSTNDQLNIRIRNAGGTLLNTLTTINAATDSTYTGYSFDLSSYAGQTITVSFEGQTNASLGTVFRLDDVSVLVQTGSSIAAPTPVTPGVGSTTATAPTGTLPNVNSPVTTLRWNLVNGATGYGVVLSKFNGSRFGDVYNTESSSFASPIKGNSFTVPVAQSAGTYRWRVRAFDANGNATGYSPWLYFTMTPTGYNRAVGIDISHYQSISSWNSVKTNGTTSTTDDTSFVFIKATEGLTYDDPAFNGFFSGAVSAGIAAGAYHFARPSNNAAVDEAIHFYNVIKSKLTAGNLVPVLDYEDVDAESLGKTVLSQWVNDFMDKFVALSGGIVPLIYTGGWYSVPYLDTSVIRYPLWQSNYPGGTTPPTTGGSTGSANAPSTTTPWGAGGWAIWQYTSSRTVAGVSSGNVDSDVANSDIATFFDQFKIRSTAKGSISGSIFNDLDADGTLDAGETGIAGRTVWLDADDDGVLDAGESTALTNANGGFSFANLLEGSYRVRQLVPSGYASTSPPTPLIVALTPGQSSTGSLFGTRIIDATPPGIVSPSYEFAAATQTIRFGVSEDIGSSLSATDLVLSDAAGNPVAFTLAYDAPARTATLTPVTTLANGSYQLTLAAGAIADLAGNVNAVWSFDFFQLGGDINRDRVVNFDDLLILAKNYGTSGQSYATGDVNGTGTVDFDDLLIIAKNYNATAPVIAPPASFTVAAAAPTRAGVPRVADSVL